MDGLLFMSVTMHSCTCSDSSAIATGRTSEDSVTRHRMIRRRHVCYVKTLAAGFESLAMPMSVHAHLHP